MTHDKPGSNSFRRSQLSATAQHCHLLPKCLLYTRSGAREPLILLEGKPEKECANVSFTCLCHLFNIASGIPATKMQVGNSRCDAPATWGASLAHAEGSISPEDTPDKNCSKKPGNRAPFRLIVMTKFTDF